MLTIRPASQRGTSHSDWLNSHHTFSFADYYDPQLTQFGHLRVINEDVIQPQSGFGFHSHHNMEILTYLIEGALTHQDSLGNGSIIKPGDIQRMSAGTGIRHSEFNHSKTDVLHLIQIWVLPNQQHLEPSYEQKTIGSAHNEWVLIASSESHPHAVKIHQNLNLWVAHIKPHHTLSYDLNNHDGWLQVVKGQLQINERFITAGDGVSIHNETMLVLNSLTDSEVLLFDMF